jgi:hypothetical protein
MGKTCLNTDDHVQTHMMNLGINILHDCGFLSLNPNDQVINNLIMLQHMIEPNLIDIDQIYTNMNFDVLIHTYHSGQFSKS